MKIFEKRPLALILCIMLGGFSFFIELDIKIKIVLACISGAIIAALFVFSELKQCRKPIVRISILFFAITMMLSALWSYAFFPTEVYGENRFIKARVYDIDNSSSSTSVLVCETEKINDTIDKHKIIVYADKTICKQVRKYDIVEFSASISDFSSYDDGFSGRTYYLSKGYSAVVDDVKDIVICENKVDKLDDFLQKLQLKITNTLKKRTNFDTGAFLSALIVGDRSDLSGNTRLNFARLGISHILALSGMHLAILSLAVNALFTRLGVRKKIRCALLLLLVLFYMGLTGFTASVMRSGIMLIISSALFLLSRKADAMTSLVIAVFLIILCDPTAVFDMSLWLSAFATLGVVIFAEMAEKPNRDTTKIRKAVISLKNACLVSVFAFCATFIFTVSRFDYFSVASVFTTIIFSFIIQIFIYAGLLLLLIGGLIPFGKIVVFISDLIVALAEWMSSFKFIYVSMNSFVVQILIIKITLFFFAFLILDIKNRKKAVTIIISLLLSVFVAAEAFTLIHRFKEEAIYTPSASGDTLLLKSDGDLAVIYSGKAIEDDAWEILDLLSEQNVTYVDDFVFASYSYSTIDFAKRIIDGIKVERIMLPRPVTKDEVGKAEGLSYLLSGYGARLEFYDILERIKFGEYEYRLIDKEDYTYGKYPANVYEVEKSKSSVTYLSVCEYANLSPSAKAFLSNSENLLIGTIGNTKYYLFDMRLSKIESIIYGDEGRLTDEAMAYYKEKGASIRCTKTPVKIFD